MEGTAYAHECKAQRPLAMEAAASALLNPLFTAPQPMQHVSDAVIERYGVDDEVIRILEGMYKSTNTMLVTVEEWDARGKDTAESQSIACYDRAKVAEAKLAERDAQIAQRDDRKKQQDLWVQFWYERCLAAEAKIAAAEEFTRQYADRVMAQNDKPTGPPNRRFGLLTVAEPTHRLGGDKAR
jgi:hypothetical protein